MIDRERLATLFKSLVEIDSVSGNERAIANKVRKIADSLGAVCHVDDSEKRTGSDTGNLILKFKGNRPLEPLLLSAHMDTVEPGCSVKPVFKDGVFTSDGTTILGADDKSAIAIILEVIRVLVEKELPCCPLEFVLTTCEEIGLQGAKNLDFSLITAKKGYVLDTSDIGIIVNQAPAANRIELKVFGKDAHAGVAPEQGINAIVLASKAIAGLKLGRIDHETTCNIGVINGGVAINIVPKMVSIQGEVRSHDNDKLDRITENIVSAFQRVVDGWQGNGEPSELPRLEYKIEKDFPLTRIPKDHPVILIAQQAASNLGRSIKTKSTGGGADANIFFEQGIVAGVIGTGMQNMHSVRESIKLDDMVQTAELLMEIVRLHST
ncbi:MAG TPA: M20/M25/M40 family metallo-hydrolase [Deltaproteobacteria bacterium]|nr:M20/M25/M40 family metallo-hydrolase [Deltaproteobacteria bacterium]